jgi:alpha-glucosidase
LYYGEEIGMRDISLKRNEILDPLGKKYWPFYKGRDGCRSPMQWDDSESGGFSTEKPWLPVHPNHTFRNVKAQESDSESMLNFTRELIKLRRANTALQQGDFTLLTEQPKEALVYLRETEDQKILVALNFKNKLVNIEIPDMKWILLFSTARDTAPESISSPQLTPYEVLILEAA